MNTVSDVKLHIVGLLTQGVLMFVPYAIAGPGLLRDDWFTLRNATFDGWWMAAGTEQWRARPVGAAIYALIFGLLGRRPLVHFVLAAVVVTSTAVLLYVVAARFLPRLAALAFAAWWLLLPNHTSLEMWASAFNIAMALFLVVLGAERLTRPKPSGRDAWLAGVLFAAGTLSYEAVGPAALAVALAVGWRRGAGRRLATALPSVGLLGLAVLWMLVNLHPEKQLIDQPLRPSLVMPGHFGYTVFGDFELARTLVPVAVLVALGVAAWRLVGKVRGTASTWTDGATVLGWVLIVLGVLPFFRYFYAPIGLGDRVTVVSGVGAALVLVAAMGMLHRLSPFLAVALAMVVIAGAVPQRASFVADYATAADDSRRILAGIEERWPAPPDHELVFGPEIERRHVRAVEPMQYPVEALYGVPVEVRDAYELDELLATPPARRFDLREYSKLDDGRLGPR